MMGSTFAILASCAAAIVLAFHFEADVPRGDVIHHHSLEPPFIHDWWQDGVPHWDIGGDAVVTNDYIRLTPQRQSRFGWIWNTQANDNHYWEAKIRFFARSKNSPGADGLAFWYVEHPHKSKEPGPLFGMPSNFKGFGVIIDSYDNDHLRDGPTVALIENQKGQDRVWDTDRDLQGTAKFRCVFDFRNTDKHDPVELNVAYYNRKVKVHIKSRRQHTETFCGEYVMEEGLPMAGYFGLTATTGHVTDNHDVVSMYVRTLGQPIGDQQIPIATAAKFDHGADQKEKEFWKEGNAQSSGSERASGTPPPA